jgi:hypothetical protein
MDALIWPGVALLLGVIAILILKKPLTRLVDRITHIDKSGIRAASQEVVAAQKPEEKQVSSRELMEVAFNVVIKDQEQLIRDQLAKIRFDSQAEKEALLTRALARSQVYAQYDRVSTLIFGSQLELLVEASSRPAGISFQLVADAFHRVKTQDPLFHEQTTLESYQRFLLNSNLLYADGDALKITTFAKEFLKYLIDNGLTHRRRG